MHEVLKGVEDPLPWNFNKNPVKKGLTSAKGRSKERNKLQKGKKKGSINAHKGAKAATFGHVDQNRAGRPFRKKNGA